MLKKKKKKKDYISSFDCVWPLKDCRPEQVLQAHWTAPWHQGHCWISGARTQIRPTTCESDCTAVMLSILPSRAHVLHELTFHHHFYPPHNREISLSAGPTSQHLFHFYLKDTVFGASKHHAKYRSVVEGGVNMVTAYIFFSSLFSHFSNALIKCFTQCDFVSHHPWIVSGMRHVDKKERREKEERKDKEAKSVAFSLLFQGLFNIKFSLLNL